MPLSPDERKLRAQLAAYSLHSQVDSTDHTEPARQAFLERFYDEVDPERELPEEERERRALAARKAYFTRLSYKAMRARSAS